MSSGDPSDPRLQLPDWLRDGDTPLATRVEPVVPAAPPTPAPEAAIAVVEPPPAVVESVAQVVPVLPYSDRLSLDTRLDPGQLVSAEDLPSWLGGLERAEFVAPVATVAAVSAPVAGLVAVEEPEPYEGVDAPDVGVIDVQVNGWYVVVAALGLLILVAAALRLYLS